jgi:hypothetical protein
MKAAIDRIKSILATKDFGTHLNHYLFEPGLVLASDGRMVAAVPTDSEFSCLVPGPELEAVLNRFSDSLTIEHVDGTLKIKCGRLHGAIQTLPTDQVEFFRPAHPWIAPPKGLKTALKQARPFIAETAVQAWALCACLHTGGVDATNNMSIIRVACAELVPEQAVLLPSWAIDFVLRVDEDLTGVIWDPNYAAFRWESGLWFRTQLVQGQFPTQIEALLSSPERATTPVEKDWRKEYQAVAELSENTITINPDSIIGGHGKASVRADIATPLPASVIFNPKFLSPVLAAADYWAPEVYPAPVPFRGDGFGGVVMGRRA